MSRSLQQAGEDGSFGASPLVDADGKPTILRYARTPGERSLWMSATGSESVRGVAVYVSVRVQLGASLPRRRRQKMLEGRPIFLHDVVAC